MEQCIIGAFDNEHEAKLAMEDLVATGIDRSRIDLMNQESAISLRSDSTLDDSQTDSHSNGMFSGMWRWLSDFGLKDNDPDYFAENVRRGGSILAVHVEDRLIDDVVDVFNRHGVVDIDRRGDYYRNTGFKSFDPAATAFSRDESIAERERFQAGGDFSIPVVEEKVNVGKKTVERGRVRIVSRIIERPVNQDVQLRDERVEVDRQRVDRPLNAGDLDAFKEGEIELRETAEVPVVNREARVVEEVRVRTEGDTRTETVHETERRTEVDVDRDADVLRTDKDRVDTTTTTTDNRRF